MTMYDTIKSKHGQFSKETNMNIMWEKWFPDAQLSKGLLPPQQYGADSMKYTLRPNILSTCSRVSGQTEQEDSYESTIF